MSTKPDSGFDLGDLELQFLPAWAKQSPDPKRYLDFEEPTERGPRRRGRPDRRDRSGPPRDRRDGPGRSDRPPHGEQRRSPARGRGGQRGERGGRPEGRTQTPTPLPDLDVEIIPEAKGIELLARQIRLTGRAYPVFDIAQLILRKHERYQIKVSTPQKPEGETAQSLWTCNLDGSLWLSDQDAVQHVLAKHFDTFYQIEKTPTDPPKGTYTFVAQCGMSGVILGPPNYHDYQTKLRRLHASRFPRVPFETYRSRVRIVRDEEVVKKWVEDQSFLTEYTCLNIPEAQKLGSMEAVETHFREVHLANIIQKVDSFTLAGAEVQSKCPQQPLRQLIRRTREDQQRFPLKVASVLSQQFATHGLQFFKVNKTVTHVAVARPHYLDLETTPVSDGVRRIVDFINATPGCTRKALIQSLAPTPPPSEKESAAPETAPAAEQTPPAETSEEKETPQDTTTSAPAEKQPEAAAAPEPAQPSLPAAPTPEQESLIADLHWLIHQGHVIEFATGRLETAKKPKPKPAPTPKKKVEKATPTTPPSSESAPKKAEEPSAPPANAPAPTVAEQAAKSPTADSDAPVAPTEPVAPSETPAATTDALQPSKAAESTPPPQEPETETETTSPSPEDSKTTDTPTADTDEARKPDLTSPAPDFAPAAESSAEKPMDNDPSASGETRAEETSPEEPSPSDESTSPEKSA